MQPNQLSTIGMCELFAYQGEVFQITELDDAQDRGGDRLRTFVARNHETCTRLALQISGDMHGSLTPVCKYFPDYGTFGFELMFEDQDVLPIQSCDIRHTGNGEPVAVNVVYRDEEQKRPEPYACDDCSAIEDEGDYFRISVEGGHKILCEDCASDGVYGLCDRHKLAAA